MNPNVNPWTPNKASASFNLAAREFVPTSGAVSQAAANSSTSPFNPLATEFLPSISPADFLQDDSFAGGIPDEQTDEQAYSYDGGEDYIYYEDFEQIPEEAATPDDASHGSTDDDMDMSPLQMLLSVFTDLDTTYLEHVLEQCEFDLDAALEFLLPQSQHGLAGQKEEQEDEHGLEEMTAKKDDKLERDNSVKRQVCRYFLAGECRRKDCWYSHDVDARVCKYWLKGACLKGEDCFFLHEIDLSAVAEKFSTLGLASSTSLPEPPGAEAYPELPGRRLGIPILPPKKSTPLTLPTFPFIMGHAAVGIHGIHTAVGIPAESAPPRSSLSHPLRPQDEQDFPTLSAAVQQKKSKSKHNHKPGSLPSPPSTTTPTNFASIVAASPPASQYFSATNRPRAKHSSSSLAHLQRPVSVPWLTTGSLLNSEYLKERAQAIQYGTQRNRLFQRATAAYLRGDGATAKRLSLEARRLNELMRATHAEASRRIFASRNCGTAFVDLHGLHVDEAVGMLGERFEALEKEGYRGVVYVVTGTGHHSGALGIGNTKAKLRPAVEKWLEEGGWRFAETSVVGDKRGGVFAVEVAS